ncbi:MAG: alpha-glucan family phosphorylase [Planctomycetota bacterium]
MFFKNLFVYPKYPENLQCLYDLAYNLWSVWDYDAVGLFYRIDTTLFREVNHNPVKLLHSLSKEKLEALSDDKGFMYEFEKVWEKFQGYLQYSGSFKDECPGKCDFNPEDIIAYFSMEFGLHESLPIYAGGLGVLAADFLKAASDLDLPVIGIGLLYKCGYFSQHIDSNGYQQEMCKTFDSHLVPIREVHDSQGNPAHIHLKILGESVKVRLSKINVGKSSLILLDTNTEDNPPHLRDITSELYPSDREKRIQQELILGIGGIKALNLLRIKPKIYHFNEGHSAFAIIGRLWDLMKSKKYSFSKAKAVIRASTVFTTHTPVIAGNEHFDTDMVQKHLESYLKPTGLGFEQIVNFGCINDNTKVFWLPAFAMRFSKYINAVSDQHAKISKKMWSGLFREKPTVEIPLVSITNGAHTSWISAPLNDLFNRYLGPNYMRCGNREEVWKNIYNIPDEELWSEHRRNKKDLINFMRRRFAEQMIARGYSQSKRLAAKRLLSMDTLTVVFSRRFAAYKRPTLILKDKKRLTKILTDSNKPVQLIFSGKAHPADEHSKGMIKEVIDFAREYNVRDRVFFLEDHDINLARHLCWGADVWLNNPSQAMEASGTSGIKAAMNGVLHASTLEGWWLEGFTGNNGWAITAGNFYDKADLKEVADANQLYDLLENEITELYYERSEADIPEAWVRMMKDAIFSVCQNFNMNRVLCDYLKRFYLPSKEESRRLSRSGYKVLEEAVEEEKTVLKEWDGIKVVSFSTDIGKRDHLTEAEQIDVQCGVQLGAASLDRFKVELFYIYDKKGNHKILEMEPRGRQNGVMNFGYNLKIEGYGTQSLNVRIKPANDIIQDIHPELIK